MEEINVKCYISDDNFTNVNDVDEERVGASETHKIIEVFLIGIVFFVVLSNISCNIEFQKALHSVPKLNLNKILNSKMFLRTLVLIILVLTIPLIIVVLLFAFVYKIYCAEIIKNKDKYFAGFLDSFDVFWSLEDDTSKSIIHVLGVIESDSPQEIINNIKYKLMTIFPNEGAAGKIFHRRCEQYGFYYWRRYSQVDINEYVQLIHVPDKDTLRIEDLEGVMCEISDRDLPYENEGLFQILITEQNVSAIDDVKGEYGIIFRIHHSVGDGVALVEFLCKTLSDEPETCVNMFSNPEGIERDNSASGLFGMIKTLCEIPICFVDGIIRNPDENNLHGPKLLGQTIYKWTDSNEDLLIKIKEIKEIADLRFSEVLSVALSSGLENFFIETMAPIPEELAVVVPVRFPKTNVTQNDMKLENDFSVTILDLPIDAHKRLEIIKFRCNKLRRSADPLTNYYFLKLVSSIFPRQFLQPLLNSGQATMVFSNMPGPKSLTICGGNLLKKMVFFVPLKGTTGVGVTALCYGNVLRFAASADRALVSDPQDLAVLLSGMVDEINRLHRNICK